jgi:hypothetical protein
MDGKTKNGETLIVTIDAHCPSMSKHSADGEKHLSEECLAVLAPGMQGTMPQQQQAWVLEAALGGKACLC